MTKLIGVIAEDQSDIDVIKTLISRLVDSRFSIKKFSGQGCGKTRAKCRHWSETLHDKGCSILIIVHDLDAWNRAKLLAVIRSVLDPSPIKKHIIVIPVHEIEAWLLSDAAAIKRVFGLKRVVKEIASPESIQNAKEYLGEVVRKVSQNEKVYVNTVHNRQLAERASIASLGRCPSFREFRDFVRANV